MGIFAPACQILTASLTAFDRGRPVPLALPTLDPGNAGRLARVTAALLGGTTGPGLVQ
jgi:hypothetical protein